MEKIDIRKSDLQDAELITELSRSTFYETFASQNTEENMSKFLEEKFSREKIAEELQDPSSNYFIAYCGDEAAGYLKLGTSGLPAEFEGGTSIEIERIYVKQQFQGKKMGLALLEFAISFATENNYEEILLGVWEKNQKAISFYEKAGFVNYGSHIFMVGDDPQNDILMRKKIK